MLEQVHRTQFAEKRANIILISDALFVLLLEVKKKCSLEMLETIVLQIRYCDIKKSKLCLDITNLIL